MRVISANTHAITQDINANLALAANTIKEIMQKNPDTGLIVFPELFCSAYTELEKAKQVAFSKSDALHHQWQQLAQQYGVALVYGYVEKADDKLYNSVVFNAPQGMLGHYRKVCLVPEVESMFTPGQESSKFIHYRGFTFAFAICWDLAFSPLTNQLKNVDVIIAPVAWEDPYQEQLSIACQARAFENACYLICANQHGQYQDATFSALGHIYDFKGQSIDNECLGLDSYFRTAVLDKSALENWEWRSDLLQHQHQFPSS